MTKPLVSVVMVVCNVERFLAEAIDSILAQTLTDFEFVIVDFGSTDNSKAIVSKYAATDRRIKLSEIPPCGLAAARNASWSVAQGRYIAVMDADDVALKDRLKLGVAFMEQHPEVGALGGAVEWIDSDGKSLAIHNHPLQNRDIQAALLEYSALWHPTAMIRREALTCVGGYRVPFLTSQDYDLWLRIGEHFELANLAQVVLRYRIHPNQVSLQKRRQQSLYRLAAQSSAVSRRRGAPDPLQSIDEITEETLITLGVSDHAKETAITLESFLWINNMCVAGEYSAALRAANEILGSPNWRHLDRSFIADMQLTVAWLHWKQKRLLQSAILVGRAVCTRPVIIGRPLRRFLRSLRSAVLSLAPSN